MSPPRILFRFLLQERLKLLYLQDNHLASSPVLAESPLASLQRLYLSGNNLTEAAFLPRLAAHSPGLEVVDLSFNRIAALPRSLFLSVVPALRVLRLQVRRPLSPRGLCGSVGGGGAVGR